MAARSWATKFSGQTASHLVQQIFGTSFQTSSVAVHHSTQHWSSGACDLSRDYYPYNVPVTTTNGILAPSGMLPIHTTNRSYGGFFTDEDDEIILPGSHKAYYGEISPPASLRGHRSDHVSPLSPPPSFAETQDLSATRDRDRYETYTEEQIQYPKLAVPRPVRLLPVDELNSIAALDVMEAEAAVGVDEELESEEMEFDAWSDDGSSDRSVESVASSELSQELQQVVTMSPEKLDLYTPQAANKLVLVVY